MPGTRKLGRPTDQRMAMLRGMVTALLENGKIETTVGKRGNLHARRQALSFITKEDVVKKVFDELAPKYAERSGGYTQIIKTGVRRGDNAPMAILKLVD